MGTAFDLEDLASDALVQSSIVNLNDIRFVRLVDIPGNGAFLDSQGRAILDAWPTAGSGGLDLDAIGARYAVPEAQCHWACHSRALCGGDDEAHWIATESQIS